MKSIFRYATIKVGNWRFRHDSSHGINKSSQGRPGKGVRTSPPTAVLLLPSPLARHSVAHTPWRVSTPKELGRTPWGDLCDPTPDLDPKKSPASSFSPIVHPQESACRSRTLDSHPARKRTTAAASPPNSVSTPTSILAAGAPQESTHDTTV